MVGKDAGETRHTQTYCADLLGTPGRVPGQKALQHPPPGELQPCRCSICSDADSALVRHGEEGAEPKGEAFDLPVDLCSYPH